MALNRDAVMEALRSVKDPSTGQDIVSADFVRAVTVNDGAVSFVLEVPADRGKEMEPVRIAAEKTILALGASQASGLLTAHAEQKPPPDLKGSNRPSQQVKLKLPGVERIIAVASGKGGVGKSTLTSNLAVALAAEGKRVALLDADVYGPSQPRMMGLSGRPSSPDGKIIEPLRNHGVTCMSIGLMMPSEDEAIIWRGPMLMGALQQMLGQVNWGPQDVLLVDLPPGTGDVQMTLAQKSDVTGAIIVSTPQDIALLDARKAMNMFEKLNVPILGMVENMSTHICSNCGHEDHIFGSGGAKAEAAKAGIPFLGEVPLDIAIRLAADDGAPVAIAKPDSAQAAAFRSIAQKLIENSAL